MAAPAGRPQQRAARPRPLGALAIAALCVAGLALTWSVAELVPSAHVRDAVLLHDFTLLGTPHVNAVAQALLHVLNPLPFILWGVALAGVALMRNRPRVALAVAAVLALAPLTSETLKPLLAHQHDSVGGVYIGPASWPSGHSTAAMALALAALLVVPRRLRAPVAAFGAVFVAAVSAALLIRAWHMPSDVLGGWLVAALWTALAVATLRALERRLPARGRRPASSA